MADMQEIVKVAVDAYRGATKKYSVGQSMELLQKALKMSLKGALQKALKRDQKRAGSSL